MSTNKWLASPGATSMFQTGSVLNAVATAQISALGTDFDNTSTLYQYALVDIILNSAITSGTGSPFFGIYLIPAPDGSTFPTVGSGATLTPSTYQVSYIGMMASASITRATSVPFIIPPFHFKLQLLNQSGAPLPASNSNVINMYPFNEQSV